jgi:hypothetical protein
VPAFPGLSLRNPSRTKLSAAATMDSSLERAAQPSTRLAFSLVEFFITGVEGWNGLR